jgi:two-component system phosphate regulon response regulator PhoB
MSLPTIDPPTVLVLFQETALAQVLEYNLSREGFAVATLAAAEAVEAWVVGAHPADIVLLQLHSATEDALQVCLGHRRSARPARILVLGPDDPSGMAAALAAGVDDWLTTPFSVRELVRRLRQLLLPRSGTREALAPKSARSALGPCLDAHAKLLFGRCPWCGEMVIGGRG